MLPQDCTKLPTEIYVDPRSETGHRRNLAVRHAHFVTVSKSFGRSPYDRTYLESRMPDFNLLSSRSHLFKNSTSSTLARSLLLHTDFQRRTLSSYYKGKG
jgi:hypothetical protein